MSDMQLAKTGRRSTDSPRILRPHKKWQQHKGGVYRCLVYLMPEDGRFSVVSADLPGVASQGDTEPEALANIIEAFQGALMVYQDQGAPIPWTKEPVEMERGAEKRWVIVHV